jgi:ADP-ribose pyrophosphatase YjhB (NUDIX family)
MDLNPQKFFIGVVDFFAVIVPGALLTYFVKDDLGNWLLGCKQYSEIPSGNTGVWIFIFSSYLLGHFVFLLGSYLFDNYLYNNLRTATYNQEIERLASGHLLHSGISRDLAALLFKKEDDITVRLAVLIKESYLSPLRASDAVNAFQWAKAYLSIECPALMVNINRFEADSKFFRSLAVVLLILLPWGFFRNLSVALICLPLFMLALWRYVDQRAKSTSQAYWYLIANEARRERGYRASDAVGSEPSHAGGVVMRTVKGALQYLLVRASDDPTVWVLPKGHIKSGEKPAEAAVREVREETGVWASTLGKLGCAAYRINHRDIVVQFYLMQMLEEGKPVDHSRQHAWKSISDPIRNNLFKEIKDLLDEATTKYKYLKGQWDNRHR